MKKSDKGFLVGLVFGLFVIAMPILFFSCGDSNPCKEVSFLDQQALIECCITNKCGIDIDKGDATQEDVLCVLECLDEALQAQDFDEYLKEHPDFLG